MQTTESLFSLSKMHASNLFVYLASENTPSQEFVIEALHQSRLLTAELQELVNRMSGNAPAKVGP